ncbi:MAG: hypothetical protein IKV08_01500 [Phascolarctobacterium sp.]|nr:hypothetical protein [Phascolarctobacterium sp.]
MVKSYQKQEKQAKSRHFELISRVILYQKQEKQAKAGVKQVANYGNYEYNIKYLVARYGIKRQTIQQCYIDKYKDQINADQVHVKKIGKEWRFTAQAVNILDGIVGYVGDKVAVADYESPEMVRIKELEKLLAERNDELDDLKQKYEAKSKTVDLQANMLAEANAKVKELEPKVLQLTAAEADNKLKADQIAELQADGERKDQAISNLQSEKEEQKAEIKALEAEKSKAEATVADYENLTFLGRLKFLFKGRKDE